MTDACKQFDARLMDLAYGELPEPQARELQAHAAQCATCRAALEEIALVRKMATQLPPLEPEGAMDQVVLSQLAEETALPHLPAAAQHREPSFWDRARGFLLSPALATAAVIALVSVISFFLVQKGPLTQQQTRESGRLDFEAVAPESASSTPDLGQVKKQSPPPADDPITKENSAPAKQRSAQPRKPGASRSKKAPPIAAERHGDFAPAPGAPSAHSSGLNGNRSSGGTASGTAKLRQAPATTTSGLAMEKKEDTSKRRLANESRAASDLHPPELESMASALEAEEDRAPSSPERSATRAASDFHLGTEAYTRGDCHTARAAFLRVLEQPAALAAEKSHAMHRIAICEKRQGRCNQAISWYEKLLRRYPRYPGKAGALFEASTCYRRLGRLEQAQRVLHQLAQIPGWNAKARRELDALNTD